MGCNMLPAGGRRSSSVAPQPLQRAWGRSGRFGWAGAGGRGGAGTDPAVARRRQRSSRLTAPLGNGLRQRDRLTVFVEQDVGFRRERLLPGAKQGNRILRGA